MDNRILGWFKAHRNRKLLITPKMIKVFAKRVCKSERNEELDNPAYWYRSFRELHRIVVRRITGLRRKKYTPEKVHHFKGLYIYFL